MANNFCLEITDVKFLEINMVSCLVLKNGFKKGAGINSPPLSLLFLSIIFGNLCRLDIGTVIALMTGHTRAHNTTADLTGRPDQSTTVITTWGGFGLRQTLRALDETLFIDQGLTPGNIDIHPQYSFKKNCTKPSPSFQIGPLWFIWMAKTVKRFKFCAKYAVSRTIPESQKYFNRIKTNKSSSYL